MDRQSLQPPVSPFLRIFYPFYFNLSQLNAKFTFFYLLILTIDYFQFLNLILFDITYSSNIPTNFPFIQWIKKLYLLYPHRNFSAARIITIILFILFIIQALFIVISYKTRFKKSSFLFVAMNYIMLTLQFLYDNFLSFPIMITLLSFYQSKEKVSVNYTIDSQDKSYIIAIILSSFSLLFFFCITLLNSFFLHNMNPMSHSPLASANNDNRILTSLLKLLVSIFYIYEVNKKIKTIIIFLLSLIIVIKRWFNIMYYNRMVYYFRINYDSGIFMMSIITLIKNIVIDFDITKSNYVLIAFSSLSFGFIMNVLIDKAILSWASSYDSATSLTSQIGIVLYIYKIALQFKENKRYRSKFLGMLSVHRIKCMNDACRCGLYISKLMKSYNMNTTSNPKTSSILIENKKAIIDGNVAKSNNNTYEGNVDNNIDVDNSEESESDTDIMLTSTSATSTPNKATSMINTLVHDADITDDDCIFGFVRVIIEHYINVNISNKEIKQNTLLIIFLSYIMKNHLHNYFKAIFEMMKLFKKAKGISEAFIVYSLMNEISDELYIEFSAKPHDEVDIEDVLHYNDIVSKLVEAMSSTTTSMKTFWSIIANIKLKVSSSTSKHIDLYSLSISLTNNIKYISSLFNIIYSNKNYTNKQIVYIYSVFLNRVVLDRKNAKDIKSKLISEGDSRLERLAYQDNELYGLFRSMDRVGITIISGSINHIGKILSINHQLCAMLNYDKDELIDEKVNVLCPSFIGQYHDEFMYRYLETAKKHIINQIRIVFASSKDNMLIPIFIFVKVIPNLSESVRFIGLIKKVKSDHPFLLANKVISDKHEDIEIENNKAAFIITNVKGEIFGETMNTMKYFGIPPNCLTITNDKNDNAILISSIFPNVNFYDDEIVKKLKSEDGLVLKLDSKTIKHLFDDYKDSVNEENKKLYSTIAKMNPVNVFREHHVLVFAFDLCFNEGQVPARIFKMIKVKKMITNTNENGSNSTTKRINNLTKDMNITNSDGTTQLNSDERRFSTPNNTAASVDFNIKKGEEETNFLRAIKKKLIMQAMPTSIKIFIGIFVIFILLVISFSICEVVLSVGVEKDFSEFVNYYFTFRKRNIYLSLIAVNVNTVFLYDNNILTLFNDEADIDRTVIVDKIKHDIDIVVELSSSLSNATIGLSSIPSSLYPINNILYIDSTNIYENYTEYIVPFNIFALIDAINVKIVQLFSSYSSLQLEESPIGVFYKIASIRPSISKASILLRDIYFIQENINTVIRIIVEKSNELIHNVVNNASNLLRSKDRIYVSIPPFILCVAGFVLFFFIVKNIAVYKTKILSLFYLVDKKYAVDAIKNCDVFINTMNKTVVIDKEIAIHNMNENEDIVNEVEIENNQPKWISFWIYDKMDENLTKMINMKNSYVSMELIKSKKKFWKFLCFIYIHISFLLSCVIAYFIVSIVLDLSFENTADSKRKDITTILTRSWTIVNLLMSYRNILLSEHSMMSPSLSSFQNYSMLTSSNLTTFDIYSLYLNQTDSVENYLLLLSTTKLKNTTHNILYETIELEHILNSDQFCNALYEYDNNLYDNFQSNCDNFYTINQGIKDSIGVIYAYLKNNFPKITNINDINERRIYLNKNISFYYNTDVYIVPALIEQIDTLHNSIIRYSDHYRHECIVRFVIIIVVICIEIILWSIVIFFLIRNVNEDKLILTLLPFDAIVINPNIFNLLKSLLH